MRKNLIGRSAGADSVTNGLVRATSPVSTSQFVAVPPQSTSLDCS
jgi:hypothetical protein